MNGLVNTFRFGSRPSGMADRCATLFAMRSLTALLFGVVFSAGVRLKLPLMQHFEFGLDFGVLPFQVPYLLVTALQSDIKTVYYSQVLLVTSLAPAIFPKYPSG